MKKLLSAIIALAVITAHFCACSGTESAKEVSATPAQTAEPVSTPTTAPQYEEAEETLAGMTLTEKIEQMIMPSLRYGDDAAKMTDSIEEALRKHSFGGVILFAENTREAGQTTRLIADVQSANSQNAKTSLLVAVDQEGGQVARLETGTQLCGNMALGATGNAENAKAAGKIIGSELSSEGFNVNFAPDVDINSNPANPVIGVRSFSDDAQTVAAFGEAYVDGQKSQGIISTLKHFPGHGDTSTDSHTGLPLVDKSYDRLKANELVPFERGINAGVEMIMTAHIQFPELDAETYPSKADGGEVVLPATLSKKILSGLLRGEMGFDGVIVTDSMGMGAITDNFGPADAAKLAINAGVNILLMPFDLGSDSDGTAADTYISEIERMVNSGEILAETIDESVLRILKLKQNHGLLKKYTASGLEKKVSDAERIVGSEENHRKEREITQKSVTIVKNEDSLLPLKSDGKKTLIFTPYDNETLSMEYAVNLLHEDSKLDETAEVYAVSYQNLSADEMLLEADGADYIIALSEVYSAAELIPGAGCACDKLDAVIDYAHSNGSMVVVLSCNLPYDAARYQTADAVVLCWSAVAMSEDPRVSGGVPGRYGPNLPVAIYTMFNQSAEINGRLPVDIPKLNSDFGFSDEILYSRGYGLKY